MRIFFIGICGSAMGNVAVSLKRMGHTIAGSDAGIYPPMSDVLAAEGVETFTGFAPNDMVDWSPELVVVGNAASRGNEQLEYLLEQRALPFISMPEAIRRFLLCERDRMVVTGTHGKTTTTTAAAFALQALGDDPGYLIGGVPNDLDSGASPGAAEAPFVLEGDEYDSAIFDKRSKFQHYFPNVLLVNNLEFDHGDIFHDEADYFRTFRHLIRLVPRSGVVVLNGDDPRCVELADSAFSKCITVGFSGGVDYQIEAYSEQSQGAQFTLCGPDGCAVSVNVQLNAEFNARNLAMAAVGAAHVVGNPEAWSEYLKALEAFTGVKRRMDVRFESEDCLVLEDFGHHPTAIAGSLKSLKARYPDCRIWAAFEPRSNTTVTNRFQSALEDAFSFADQVHIAPVFRPERVPEATRLNADAVASACSEASVAWQDWQALEQHLLSQFVSSEGPRLLVFFSNGAFNGLITSVTKALKS